MSEERKNSDSGSLDGWSIVRHRDDVGSDADSVEVISDDSDRDTCDEGKDAGDDDPEVDLLDSTEALVDSTTSEDNEFRAIDDCDQADDSMQVGLLSSFTRKMNNFLLVPSNPQNDRVTEELKLRYVILASTLLALICSLLASSYLLFHKLQEFPDKVDESSSTQVLQELEQAISKLQSVLRLENDQRVKEVLSRMPREYLNLDNMISNDGLKRRKAFRRSQPLPKTSENEDFGVIMSIESSEIRSDVHEEALQRRKATSDGMNLEIDSINSLANKLPKIITDVPSNSKNSIDETQNSPKDVAQNAEISAQELKSDDNFELLDDGRKDSKSPTDSDVKDVILSIRKDILTIQNQLYSQIMNSLFEYKIDLYKNLMRVGLDSTCNVDPSGKKTNHKKFMMIRNLQHMIAKSSEANFESWYKFYSFSVSPQFRTVVSKLDSIANEDKTQEGVLNEEKIQGSTTSDDFFVRSTVPVEGSNYQIVRPQVVGGFDWKNLDKRIRDMNKSRITRDVDSGKDSGSIMTSSDDVESRNDVEKETNSIEPDKKRDVDEIMEQKVIQKVLPVHSEEPRKEDGMKSKVFIKEEKRKYKETMNKRDFEKDKNNKRNNKMFDKNQRSKEKNYEKPDQKDKMYGGNKGNRDFGKEYCLGGKCDKRRGKDYYFHDGKPRRKSFLNNMTKYVKKAASGLWKTVRGGFKKVKNYGSYIKDWHVGEDKGKGNYEEWRKEFVKEMKDVIKVLGVNPAINGLYEFPKSVSRFVGDGLGKLMNSEGWIDDEDLDGVRVGPDGVKLEECNTADGDKMSSYGTCSPGDSDGSKMDDSDSEDEDDKSWYAEAAQHRAKSRGGHYPGSLPRSSDPSWFLGLGRHRSYLRRRGIHLDDDGSWFISSARHRAKLRERHSANPPHFTQASSKR